MQSSTPTIVLLLGSAAVGALVSSTLTLLGQWQERKSRREELLMAEANKLAMAHHASLLKFAELTRQSRFIPEDIKLTQTYFVGLKSLMETGKFPRGMFANSSPSDKEEFERKHGGWA